MTNLPLLDNTVIGDASNVSDWFKKLWEGIVSYFTTGQLTVEGNTVATSFLGKIIVAIIVFVPLYLLIRIVIHFLKRPSKRKDATANTYKSFVASTVKVVLYFILILTIFSILGIPISGFANVISSAVVAIGLSLQSVISNFAAGVIVLSTKKFLKGDYISLNNGTAEGTVIEIKMLETKLLTPENIIISIPNSDLFTGIVANYSVMQYRRIDLTISVDYSSDVDAIKKILLYTVKKQTGINQDMSISVFLKEYSASSLDFSVRAYAPISIFWDVKWALQEKLYTELENRNVKIPYNQLDVHIDNNKETNKKIDVEDIKESDIKPIENPKSHVISRDDLEKDDAIDQILTAFTTSQEQQKEKLKKKKKKSSK